MNHTRFASNNNNNTNKVQITLNKCDKIVILCYCRIYRQSDLFDCEKAFLSILSICIILSVDFNG